MELPQWMKPASNEVRIYPWSVGATGMDEGSLAILRDTDVDQLARFLNCFPDEEKSNTQLASIMELVTHGYWEKAALLARELLKSNPEIAQLIKRNMSGFDKKLLTDRISSLPKDPTDFPAWIKISFVQ
ncbi:MAG TPA: hypothetical protein VJ246_00805 [Patescibacteria group bacterium]|nr:hypothetical protein [Patescibacteria group bacterium]